MCVQDSIGVEEQAYLVENMPQIDDNEMFHVTDLKNLKLLENSNSLDN